MKKCISYTFSFSDGHEVSFDVDLMRCWPKNSAAAPAWTKLEFHGCSNCPLKGENHPYCPAAFDLIPLVDEFKNRNSYEECLVRVHSFQRDYVKTCSLQEGLASLAGLVMSSSNCPHLAKLRRLAQGHVPFISVRESVRNLTGSYLIRQYLARHDKPIGPANLDPLRELMKEVHTVNQCFFNRLKEISGSDSLRNALNNFVAFTELMQFDFDGLLEEASPHTEDLSITSLPLD